MSLQSSDIDDALQDTDSSEPKYVGCKQLPCSITQLSSKSATLQTGEELELRHTVT